MRSILKSKKGQLGLNAVRGFIVAILVIAVLAMAVLIVLGELDSTSVATGDTKNITSNVTQGVLEFFSNSETFFALLAIAVIILIVGLVILAVNRFGGTAAGGQI